MSPAHASTLLLALSVPAGAGELEFDSLTVPFGSGIGSAGIAAADLDGDGDLDLAAGLHFTGAVTNNRLALWTNDGTGSMSLTQLLPLPAQTTAVAAGDLDLDGDVDLVVSNFSPANSVSVLENLGSGSFARSDVGVVAIPTGLVLADVDGDGSLDIAVSLRSVVDHSVGVLLNSGAGSFSGPPVMHPVGLGPHDVIAGDFDLDGDVDLASVDRDDDTVSVLRSLGGGNFAPRVAYAVGSLPERMALGDVNGDAIPDLVVSNDLTAALTCLLGDGAGSFPTRVDHPISLRGRELALVDLDQDGALDVAVGIAFTEHALVLRNDGAGGFEAPVEVSTGYDPLSLVAADLDGDGDADLATADDGLSGTATLSVLTNVTSDELGSSYCFGRTCPCGNEDPGAGCANSTGAGALLVASGSASVAADDLVLSTTGVPPNQFGLVFMGPVQVELPFVDGLRCVGSGGVGQFRFPAQNAGSGGTLTEGPGIAATSEGFALPGHITAGASWSFQAWFRDPSGPCGNGSNTSNGVTVSFQP